MTRRYSEFVFLWDCLMRRYPFRLLPQLPPKRIGREYTSDELKALCLKLLQPMSLSSSSEGMAVL